MPGSIDHLIVKVAELCNLNCSYCYLYQHEDQSFRRRPKVMTDAVFDRMLGRVEEYRARRAPHQMSLVFHGGEPTLIGAARMARLAARAREVLGKVLADLSMQTNATLLDEQWVDVIRQHRIRICVSVDGPPEVHDAVRIDHAGRGSHAATLEGLALLDRAGIAPSILCVIKAGADGRSIYRYFRSLGIARMDFLLPDVSHDNKSRFYGDCGETPVADYLIPIFDDWFGEGDPEIRIRVFWSLLASLLGGSPQSDAFGNPLVSYLIVETDGAIQGLDALRVCADGIAESGLNVMEHGFDDLHLGLPLVHQLVHVGVPLSATCRSCPEVAICGGGYLPHRYSRKNGFDNPSVWCQDIQKLLEHVRSRLYSRAPC